MTSFPIIASFQRFKQLVTGRSPTRRSANLSNLPFWANYPDRLPGFVQQSPVAQRYLHLLAPLAWAQVPQRRPHPNGCDQPVSYATLAAACLVKLDQQLVSMGRLRQYLLDHPALLWLLDFPRLNRAGSPQGFNPQACLPTARHFTRLLRNCPNSVFQSLLDSSVNLIQAELAELNLSLGQAISLDTKHIIAWVDRATRK